MNTIDGIFIERCDCKDFADTYLNYLADVFSRIDRAEIARFVDILLDVRARGGTVYFTGNGGSAATASHFANDLSIGTHSWHKPFRVVSLCDNQAILTAIANDSGYDNIFVQQLMVLLKREDAVVAISASGNSPSVVKAVEYANDFGVATVALTAFDGGKLRKIATHAVHIPTMKGEYGPAEDGHMVLDHLISNYLMRLVREEKRLEDSLQEETVQEKSQIAVNQPAGVAAP